MRVYVSSSDTQKAREAAALLTILGHEVVSEWHRPDRPHPSGSEGWADAMRRNLLDIERAELVVCVAAKKTKPGSPGPGMYLEVGYALRGNTPVILLGKKTPNPARHPGVRHVRTADELEAAVKALAR